MSKGDLIRGAIIAIALAWLINDEFSDKPKSQAPIKIEIIRPKMPEVDEKKINPELSQKLYVEGMRAYILDNVLGYKQAVRKLLEAAANDPGNVKAYSMLASSYLNLIDSSNKDENYFSVISKLIELARAKSVDLAETVIADVEFYIFTNRAEAAINRVVEYTKSHPNFDASMFFYLSLAYVAAGDYNNAANYLAQFPESKIFSARIPYLRGLVAEKLGDDDAALKHFEKALKINSKHALSKLHRSILFSRQGKLKEDGESLQWLVDHPELLAPKDLGLAYFYYGRFQQLNKNWEVALQALERATKLDRENREFSLEYYTMKAKQGELEGASKLDAKMYYFLSEGERLMKEGRSQDALTQFLSAREANPKSTLPLMRIGDLFMSLNDVVNAKSSYQKAAERAPNSIEIWSKYMNTLIQSYDWEEAQKAMAKFRDLPVSQSAIDKAAGDMYAKQGRHVEAQVFYKKAMMRETIDPDVYIAFAKSLMATKNFKDAPFFFALALRFDPLNMEAVIGTATCVANVESKEAAISMLHTELNRRDGAKAELLAAIADLFMQKGDYAAAESYVKQSMAANPEYAYPWKLQAQLYLNREGTDKKYLEHALDAFKSYSDRNPSDPSGYLERYRLFVKQFEFEKAGDELNRIYEIYPKYPNLHYYKGQAYLVQQNYKVALEEFQSELKNNPNSISSLLAAGDALLKIGDAKAALTYLAKAMQLAPTNAEAKNQSGYANYLLKNFQGAVALFNAALVFDKGNPEIYKRLGMAYKDMGDLTNARVNFRKYLEMEPDAKDKAEFERYL